MLALETRVQSTCTSTHAHAHAHTYTLNTLHLDYTCINCRPQTGLCGLQGGTCNGGKLQEVGPKMGGGGGGGGRNSEQGVIARQYSTYLITLCMHSALHSPQVAV